MNDPKSAPNEPNPAFRGPGTRTGEELLGGEERVRVVSLDPHPAAGAVTTVVALRRLGTVVLGLFVLVAITYLVPGLERFQPWAKGEHYIPFWNLIGREWLGQEAELLKEQRRLETLKNLGQPTAPESNPDGKPQSITQPILAPWTDSFEALGSDVFSASGGSAEKAVRYPEYPGHEQDEAPEVQIEHPDRLDHYFAKLTLVDLKRKGAIARAGHWGDSILGDDGLTHAIRSRLQARFGDAGHGFHVLGRYNLAYLHRGVRYRDRGGWTSRCEIIFKCEPDGRYGYGGVSTRSSGGGTAWWATTKEGLGNRVSRFELWYAKMPDGGDYQVKIDGELQPVVHTASERLEDGVSVFEVPDGPHEFEVRAIGEGVSRGYGVVLERAGPGVVWDGLGLIGSFTQRLDYQDPEHIAWQIRERDVDLLVFLLGGNDVQRETMDLWKSMDLYEEEYRAVVRKFRSGKPKASCLVMSVTDHGERVGRHGIRSRRILPRLVASQRKVAEEQGCAFFDTFQAMGGEDSIARWYRSDPPLAGGDLGHPTSAGHEVLAALTYRALMHRYAEFRIRKTGDVLPSLQSLQAESAPRATELPMPEASTAASASGTPSPSTGGSSGGNEEVLPRATGGASGR